MENWETSQLYQKNKNKRVKVKENMQSLIFFKKCFSSQTPKLEKILLRAIETSEVMRINSYVICIFIKSPQ